MRKRTMIGGLFATALAVLLGSASPMNAQQYYGGGMPGMMGPGYGCPGCMPNMMGYGMMGGGMMGGGMMGPSMMGWAYGPQHANLNLSTNDVKNYLDRWIAMMGNPHLKAGPIAENDSNTITAEVVTADKGDVVQRFSIDRRNGFWQPVQ